MTSKLPDFWHASPDKNKHHDPDSDETRSTQQEIRHRFIREIEKLKEDYETKVANNEGQSDENRPVRKKNEGKDTTGKDLAEVKFKCHVMQVTHALRELKDWYDWDVDYETPDYKTVRHHIRKRHWWLYSPVTLNIVTFLTLVLGILEILVGVGYLLFPKDFIPGLRIKSLVSLLFYSVEVVQGFTHIVVYFISGLGFRKLKSWEIGVVIAPNALPFQALALTNLGLLIGVYIGCQDWRIIREMYRHLSLYNRHWFSQDHWDFYQSKMHCCGVEDYTDWFYRGPLLNALGDDFFHVPESCCKISGCTTPSLYGNNTGNHNIYSSGCLKRTLICMNFILGFAALCIICNFILSGVAYLSYREAKLYSHKGPLNYRDPLHRKLFENRLVKSENMDDRELLADARLEKRLKLLNFYSYQIAKHIGLRTSIESINFDHNMDTIKRFLDFMQERPDLWDHLDAQMAMEDIENFLNNFESEKFELMQQSKLKDHERFTKTDLVRNSGLDESDSSLNESSIQPAATAKIVDLITGPKGTLASPQEIAEVIHALRLDLNKQEEVKIVYRLAEKLSTIYEVDEALQSESEHDDSEIILPENKVPPGTRSTNNVVSPNQFKLTHPNNVQSTPNVKAQSQGDDKTQKDNNKPILKENEKSQGESKPPEKVEDIPSPIPQSTPVQSNVPNDTPETQPNVPNDTPEIQPNIPNDTPETPVKEKTSDSSSNN